MGVSINDFYRLKNEGKTGDLTFAQLSAKITESRSSLIDDSWFMRNFPNMFGNNGANVNVTYLNALGLSAYKRCVELLGSGMASLTLKLIEDKGNGKTTLYDHPSIKILKTPNGFQTGYAWRYWMETTTFGRGNCYSYIKRDGKGRPIELVPIWNPDTVFAKYVGTDVYYYSTFPGIPSVIPATDMIHFKGLTWDNPLIGVSPITYHAETLGTAIAAEHSAGVVYKAGQVKFAVSSSENIKQDQQLLLKESLADVLMGNSNSTVLPPNGKIEQLSLSPKDADYISMANLKVDEIGRIFGVPNSMLNRDGSTKGSAEQDYQTFYSNTLLPNTISREAELEAKLLYEIEKPYLNYRHNYNSMLRADATTRFDAYGKAFRLGVLNADTIADLEDLPRPENGEKYYVETNLFSTQNMPEWELSKINQNNSKQNPNPNGNN